jgi:hypothetical protein
MGRRKDRQAEIYTDKQTDRPVEIHSYRKTGRWVGGQTGRPADRESEGDKDRNTHIHTVHIDMNT